MVILDQPPRGARVEPVSSIAMALLFWPRGGSAQVARYLARALARHDVAVTLATGSLGSPGTRGDAADFFADVDIAPFAYDLALADWESGDDPMDSALPMHPSFEARSGVPDRVITDVSAAQLEHAVDAWTEHLRAVPAFAAADVLHVHHLGALQLAVGAATPHVPVVTHLHGTELKLLDAIERGVAGIADRPHVDASVELLRAAARASDAVVVNSPHDLTEALRLLPIDPSATHELSNGVDTVRFAPRLLDPSARRANWRRWLVEDPQGWDAASGSPGSIRYDESVLDRFFEPSTGAPNPVLLFVGRFLGFKRVPLLIRAYARACGSFEHVAPLVIWGGAPGEWEGEHPHDVACELGVEDVFFAGWRGHDELPAGLASADALVAPSVDEPFGQVYLEAMACGLPVVGTTTGGPPSFVNVHPGAPDGWLVPPDDVDALAAVLVELVNAPADRRLRGASAVGHVGEDFAWSAVSRRFLAVYGTVARVPARA